MSFLHVEQRAAEFQRARSMTRAPQHTSTRRTYEQLRSVIRAGMSARSNRLQELTISQDFGASRNSVRLALAMLVEDGLISRIPRVGTVRTNDIVEFAIPRIPPRDYVPAPDQEPDGLEVVSLQDGVIPTPALIGELLGTDARLSLTYVQLGFHNDQPVFQRTGVVPLHVEPEEFFARLESLVGISRPDRRLPKEQFLAAARDEDMCDEFTTLFDARYGRTVNRVEAMSADDQSARVLAVEPGAPVVARQQFTLDDSGAVREYTLTQFRGDRSTLSDARDAGGAVPPRRPTGDGWVARLDHELLASMRDDTAAASGSGSTPGLGGTALDRDPVEDAAPASREATCEPTVVVPACAHPESTTDGIALHLVEHSVVAASPLVQVRMSTSDESVSMVEEIGTLDGRPLFVRTTYRLQADAPHLQRVGGALHAGDAVTEAGFAERYGCPAGRAVSAIEAVRSDKRTATAMRVPVGTPMLARELVLEDAEGCVRELSFTHFRSDRVAVADD
ncbi:MULTISPECIES: UTRA domain-containing protein [Curtobacterium]|uniref:UTRA domain-containing protein n=1 Tax=Curtobacterium flaccumfaciens TaxID=2035 RepID=UPI003EE486F5